MKKRRERKVRETLKVDVRVEGDPRYGNNLFVQENEYVTQLAIPVSRRFKNGDRVRVTVQKLESKHGKKSC